MARLTKKEKEYIKQQYKFLNGDGHRAIKFMMIALNIKDDIEKDIIKDLGKSKAEKVDEIERLITKAKGKGKFKISILDTYFDDAEFMENLDDEDKRLLRGNIKLLNKYLDYQLGKGVEEYLEGINDRDIL